MPPRPIRSLKADIGMLAVGQVLSSVGLLAGTRVLTALVRPAVFGTVALLLGIVTLCTNLFSAPLMQSTLRLFPRAASDGLVPELRRELRRLLAAGVSICASGAAVVGVVLAVLRTRSAILLLPLMAILAIDVARTLDLTLLTAARRQRTYALWSAAETWVRPLAAILLVSAINDSSPVVLTAYAIGSGALYAVVHNITRDRAPCDHSEADTAVAAMRRELIACAAPLVPLALISWVSSISDRYVIGGVLGLAQVGIYAAAYGLISRGFLTIANVVIVAIRPLYFEALQQRDGALERTILRRWVLAAIGTSAAAFVPVAIASRPLADLLLDRRFRASAPLMPWIAGGYALLTVAQTYSTVSLGHNRPSFVLLGELAAAIGSIVIAVPLIWRYGLNGAAWSVPLYFGLQLAVSVILAERCRRRWRDDLARPI